jgi:O-antigen/teichoic acid export membrane protein
MTDPGGCSAEDRRAAATEDAGAGHPVRVRGRRLHRYRDAARRLLDRLRRPGWALLDQCVVSAANFLTIYFFARHMGTHSFGVFMLAHTGLMLLTSMQSALVIQPHNVLAARLRDLAYRRFTGALVLMQMSFCAAVGVVLGAVGWSVARLHSPGAGSVLLVLALVAMAWMGQEFVRRVLYTRGETRSATLNDTATYGLQLTCAYVLARFWADRASPEAALAVLGATSLVGVVMGFWQLRDHVHFAWGRLATCARTWHEVWHFGKWLTGQNGLVWVGSHGHTWLVGILLGAEQVGFYRAVTHLINVMNPVRQAAYAYLPSRGSLAYHAGGVSGLSQWVKKMSWALQTAITPFYVVLVGFPAWVLTLAYGERYATTELALILALSTVAQCITFSKFPFDIGLMALKATKAIFYIHFIPVVLLFSVGAAFIHFLGLVGIPLSQIVINSALLLATWVAYRRSWGRSTTVAPGLAR